VSAEIIPDNGLVLLRWTQPRMERNQRMTAIFKIVPKTMWQAAEQSGVFKGAPVDLADGFIHFSSAEQVRETAAKHFAGQNDLLIVAFDDTSFGRHPEMGAVARRGLVSAPLLRPRSSFGGLGKGSSPRR
jgi:hypothetical protein